MENWKKKRAETYFKKTVSYLILRFYFIGRELPYIQASSQRREGKACHRLQKIS